MRPCPAAADLGPQAARLAAGALDAGDRVHLQLLQRQLEFGAIGLLARREHALRGVTQFAGNGARQEGCRTAAAAGATAASVGGHPVVEKLPERRRIGGGARRATVLRGGKGEGARTNPLLQCGGRRGVGRGQALASPRRGARRRRVAYAGGRRAWLPQQLEDGLLDGFLAGNVAKPLLDLRTTTRRCQRESTRPPGARIFRAWNCARTEPTASGAREISIDIASSAACFSGGSVERSAVRSDGSDSEAVVWFMRTVSDFDDSTARVRAGRLSARRKVPRLVAAPCRRWKRLPCGQAAFGVWTKLGLG